MPHMSVEHSANIDERVDLDAFCDLMRRTILDTGLFEVGAVRVRALRAEHFSIADNLPENGFVDLNFRIGKGRTAEEKKRAGDAIVEAASQFLAPLLAVPHFALSLEIREIDPEFSWKKNAMHARLRKS